MLVLHQQLGPKLCHGARGIAVPAGQIVTGVTIAIVRAVTVVRLVQRGLPRAGSRLMVRRRAVRHGDATATGVTRVAEIAATTGHGVIAIATKSAVQR